MTNKKVQVVLTLMFCISMCYMSCSKGDAEFHEGKEDEKTDIEKYVSSAYVKIGNDVTVQKCDTAAGEYQVSFKNNVPDIKAGSVVVITKDSMNCIVLVTNATTQGETVTMKGRLGDLSYIFSDTELTLVTGGTGKMSNASNVHHPVNLDGTRASWDIPLWSSSKKITNDIYNDKNVRLWTEAEITENLNASMVLSFGKPVTTKIEGISFIKSRDFDVDFSVNGNFGVSYDVFFKARGKGRVNLAPKSDEKKALLMHNLFPKKDYYFLIFEVVPVKVTIGCDLFGEVDLSYDAELDFSTGVEAKASGTIGVRYDGTKNDNIRRYNEMSFTCERHDPKLEGKAKIDGKVHIFPRIHAWLYDFVGPSVDIKPYAKVQIGGSFGKSIGNVADDYLASYVGTYVGLDVAAGVSICRQGYEVKNWSTEDFNIREFKLYESPVDIKLKEGKNNDDGTIDVTFEVYDRGFDGTVFPSPLWPIVKFEAEGEIDKSYKTAESGIVTVKWKPKNRPSKLYAKIYSANGSVLAQAEYECKQSVCGRWVTEFEEVQEWCRYEIGPEGIENYEEASYPLHKTYYMVFKEDGTGYGTFGETISYNGMESCYVEKYHEYLFNYTFDGKVVHLRLRSPDLGNVVLSFVLERSNTMVLRTENFPELTYIRQ